MSETENSTVDIDNNVQVSLLQSIPVEFCFIFSVCLLLKYYFYGIIISTKKLLKNKNVHRVENRYERKVEEKKYQC